MLRYDLAVTPDPDNQTMANPTLVISEVNPVVWALVRGLRLLDRVAVNDRPMTILLGLWGLYQRLERRHTELERIPLDDEIADGFYGDDWRLRDVFHLHHKEEGA